METTLRACARDELKEFLETCETAFGWQVRDSDVAHIDQVLEPDRTLAAFDGDYMCGTTAAFSFETTVPGARVPAAGVTMVGVLPSHRRRGVLNALMRAQLEDIHDRGEPLALLWSSESGIYGRYGYGTAVRHLHIDLPRDRAAFRDDGARSGRVRLLGPEDSLDVLPTIYERVCERTPGMYRRSREWWEHHRLVDEEHHRDGGSPLYRAVWEDEGGTPSGYALYRIYNDWQRGHPAGHVYAAEVVGDGVSATREIWRFVCAIDLVANIRGHGGSLEHPLMYLLEEPRRLNALVQDALWVRIVDVPGALAARTYGADGAVTLEVSDTFCPWNEGRWRIEVDGEKAAIERTSARPDLRVPVRELGSVYLGGFTFGEWARAGYVEETSPGAVGLADSMFRSDVPPSSPEIF